MLEDRLKTRLDDSIRISVLGRLARLYNDYFYDLAAADSIAGTAVKIAEMSFSPRMMIEAYNSYIETTDPEIYGAKSLEYGSKAILQCRYISDPLLAWRSYHNLVAVTLGTVRNNYLKAEEVSQRALDIARALGKADLMTLSYIDLGLSQENANRKIEALRTYLKAMDMADSLGDINLRINCYARLSAFYRINKLYDKATAYKQQEGELIRKAVPPDSVAIMWIIYDLQWISSKTGVLNEKVIREIIDYAIRKKNKRLEYFAFTLIGTHLIDSERIEELKQLYYQSYPSEFLKLKKQDPGLFYRLKAFFCEIEGKLDSTIIFYRLAEKLIRKSPNLILQSKFEYRYGQFYIRQKNNSAAIKKYTEAYDLAEKASYSGNSEYMLQAALPLERLYLEKGDFVNAYRFSVRIRELTEMITAIEKKDQVLMLDLTNAQQKRDIENLRAKQRDEQIIRKRKTERNMTAAGALFIVVIAWFIYRNYRNQKHLNRLLDAEKQKSDQLLLNILPNETAEELKLYGEARARRFDEVTVMFTDFKDFTITSERMEAEDLVRIIHRYFSEFDRIISRHNLEKIKIIGDSYMCAGGLPVPNTTHAVDMVRAALELQAFMAAERGRAREADEPAFELRVGIHTGPVVAGIVGLNKFAYDIWGDTVNTASRMESSGEVNRVNISGRTWELVSKRYRCTYRGKVKAKNKGEIDMYFVEGEKE